MSSLDVKIIGPIYDTSGIAQTVRESALALYDIGINVNLIDIPDFNPVKANIQPERLIKLQKMQGGKVGVNYVAIHMYPVERILKIDDSAKANIVWAVYETDRIPYIWSLILNKKEIDAVFVPTEFNKETFIKGGVSKDKIFVAPFGVDSERYTPNGEMISNIKEKDGFYFGFVSTLKICKGYDAMLSAFFEEFKDEPRAKLIMKTDLNTNNLEREKEYISTILKNYKKDSKAEIIYIAENMSEEKMEKLYRTFDCLVLPTRGEGWGLPILQAMSSGIVPIVTNCTAQRSYCNSDNALLVDAYMKKITNIEWLLNARFQQEHSWWEPDYIQLKKHMRYAFEHKDVLKTKGEAGRKTAESLDWKNSVVKMLPLLKKYI